MYTSCWLVAITPCTHACRRTRRSSRYSPAVSKAGSTTGAVGPDDWEVTSRSHAPMLDVTSPGDQLPVPPLDCEDM